MYEPSPPATDTAEKSVTGPFFVAGTGRSGTSRMTKVLGTHPLVHAIEWESRFIVDPGGLEDLARTLTDGWTPYAADDALIRLSKLLGERLTGQSMDVFRGWGLVDEIGPETYWPTVDRLWESLIAYEFDEFVAPAGWRSGQRFYMAHERRSHRRVIGRYFADRTELIGILRTFVSSLFDPVAQRHGKATWVEKTPLNMLSMPFLWELYPSAGIVHMLRDPVMVVASHLDQGWAPRTLDNVLDWLEPIYLHWLRQRPALLADHRYVELRLDDLADGWTDVRPDILRRLSLPDSDQMAGFDAEAIR
ncbi:MAG TPA: sulfotransferase, partial [Micromonosporaceae bacterium]